MIIATRYNICSAWFLDIVISTCFSVVVIVHPDLHESHALNFHEPCAHILHGPSSLVIVEYLVTR